MNELTQRSYQKGVVTSASSTIRVYYLFQFFFTLLFWTPIFFEFQRRIGLSDPDIFRIQSIYYVVFCFCEIPTGYFADRFGYVRSMKLGALTLIASHIVAVTQLSYGGMLAHWVLVALARSFVSGASSAYLYEYLRSENAHAEFKQIEGNARAYSLFGRVACFAAVGFLMAWKMTLPYWLTLASATVSLGFAFALPVSAAEKSVRPAPGSHSASVAPKPRRASLFRAFLQATRSPKLLLLMLQGIVLFVVARIVSVNLFQPILGAKGFGVAAYGVVMGAMTLFEAVGSARPKWMRRWFSDIDSVFVLSLAMGACTLALPYFPRSVAIAALMAFSIVTGLSYPIQRQVMNEAIPDPEFRATVLSVESLIDRGVMAIVAAVLERTSDRMDAFLIVSGALSILLITAVQFALRAKKK